MTAYENLRPGMGDLPPGMSENLPLGMGQTTPEDSIVRAKAKWVGDSKIVRSKMKNVFQTMTGSSSGSSSSKGMPRSNRRCLCLKGTPRGGDGGKKMTGWEHMVQVELQDGASQTLHVELIEILAQYSVALLLHMRESLEMNTEVGRASRAKGPQDLTSTSKNLHTATGRDDEYEADYEAKQRDRLQRCGTLYANVLFVNTASECNHSEDQSCFEKLYTFISKSVLACVKGALEDHEIWPKTGPHTRLRPAGIVDEELGRLFRSQSFNLASRSKVRKRERVAFEQRGEASDEDTRFSLRPEEDAKDQPAGIEEDGSRQQKLSPIDTIVARFQGRKGPRVRPEGSDRARGAIRDAAASRSPMISSLLPSPRQKMLEVNSLSATIVGLTPRKHIDNGSPTSTLLSSTLPPVHSAKEPRTTQKLQGPTLTNTWALSRSRVAHHHKLGSSHIDFVAGFGRQTM